MAEEVLPIEQERGRTQRLSSKGGKDDERKAGDLWAKGGRSDAGKEKEILPFGGGALGI